mmetsp:Transcript_22746/g.56945  ORF Transcript_22746/g.56945 Transcript_22746/m.56945 type:complete len:234 (-) Transcript_22746:430-1131(-)
MPRIPLPTKTDILPETSPLPQDKKPPSHLHETTSYLSAFNVCQDDTSMKRSPEHGAATLHELLSPSLPSTPNTNTDPSSATALEKASHSLYCWSSEVKAKATALPGACLLVSLFLLRLLFNRHANVLLTLPVPALPVQLQSPNPTAASDEGFNDPSSRNDGPFERTDPSNAKPCPAVAAHMLSRAKAGKWGVRWIIMVGCCLASIRPMTKMLSSASSLSRSRNGYLARLAPSV